MFASQKISPFNRSIGSDVLIFSLGRFRNERQTIGSSRRRRRVFLDVLRTRRLTYFFFPFQRRPRRPKQAHERYTLKKNGRTAAITSPRWLCISPSIFKHGSRRRGGQRKSRIDCQRETDEKRVKRERETRMEKKRNNFLFASFLSSFHSRGQQLPLCAVRRSPQGTIRFLTSSLSLFLCVCVEAQK